MASSSASWRSTNTTAKSCYGPEIISRGFVYVREQEELIKRAQDAVSKVIKKKTPVSVLENKIKDALGNFAAREIGRRPMILPLVIEV